mmetsp:Transcript_50680/g.99686  ORF Transcript_50680/g.99686 Transcript_50680/m.99686 type:complete len:177 (-) Transcript_50680:46-576(-)
MSGSTGKVELPEFAKNLKIAGYSVEQWNQTLTNLIPKEELPKLSKFHVGGFIQKLCTESPPLSVPPTEDAKVPSSVVVQDGGEMGLKAFLKRAFTFLEYSDLIYLTEIDEIVKRTFLKREKIIRFDMQTTLQEDHFRPAYMLAVDDELQAGFLRGVIIGDRTMGVRNGAGSPRSRD